MIFRKMETRKKMLTESYMKMCQLKTLFLLSFREKKDSKYKLEVKIENKDEAVLHKSGVEIHTRSEKTK